MPTVLATITATASAEVTKAADIPAEQGDQNLWPHPAPEHETDEDQR